MRKNSYLPEIGERLQKKRKELNVRQRAMAKALGIAPTYLSELENGKGNPGPDIFVNLSLIYGINLQYLLVGDEDTPEDSPEKKARRPNVSSIDLSKELDSIDDLIFLMENSPFIRNSVMAWAAKYIMENKEFLEMALDKKLIKK